LRLASGFAVKLVAGLVARREACHELLIGRITRGAEGDRANPEGGKRGARQHRTGLFVIWKEETAHV